VRRGNPSPRDPLAGGEGAPPASMEVKLWNDKRERELLESYADLYAIIKVTEKLERAYVRDLVSAADYEAECLKLISQFNSLSSSLAGTVAVPRFVQAYRLDCPAALNRLLQSGVPATVELRAASASSAPAATSASAAAIAHCVQTFITAMDAVKLNMLANDQVRPLLQDVATSMARLGSLLPPDFEGKVKVNEWLGKLHKMGAADELTEQQARQLNFDLDSAYSAFLAALPAAGL
jgi:ESCRT-I complex subunit VPS28